MRRRTKPTSGNTRSPSLTWQQPFIAPTMDVADSVRKRRFHAYGWTATGWYVKIWYTYRGDVIRIIGGMKMK